MPMHNSIAVDSPIEIIDVVPINPQISKCQIKVCYVGDEPNRNGSIITKAVAMDMAKTLPGCPIVGYWSDAAEDFDGHNQIIDISNGEWKIKDTTQPYGFVDLNAKVWFQKFADDGVVHEYLMTEGYLWTDQYPETKRILEKGNNQSMELNEKYLQGFWSESNNEEPSFFIINEAIISKLCILGEDVEPCFEGSQITRVQFSLEEDFKQKLFNMMNQVKEIAEKEEKEGGIDSVENEVINPEVMETEETVIEENPVTEEEEPQAEEENKTEEDKSVEYNLEEIQEYVELKADYDNLQTQFNEMKAEYDTLVAFKAEADRKEKQAMIDSFYMLSSEDKKDVIDNIDNYSLDDIEAKLSIICVRNKVNFNLDEGVSAEKKDTVVVLDSVIDDDVTPAWVKAAIATKKEME